ncbi:MAG: hypothetical protein IT184_02255 [Acidobacteria bacterium]|nr:hypothetical protein [Acidobacteriota bacterium]
MLLFVAAGVVAWRFTAPPAPSRAPRLSWTAFRDALRPGGPRPAGSASATTRGTITVAAATTEVRLSNIARLQATGEDRDDIAYELTVDALAATDEAARDAARSATLVEDRVGAVLALRLDRPAGARATAGLIVRLPSRLALRTDGGSGTGRVEISTLASVRLESIVGDVRIADIAGGVSGSHRNGELSIAGAEAVHLSLVSSNAEVRRIRDGVTATARNGRLLLAESDGPIELDVTNEHATIAQAAGSIHVLGSGGTLRMDSPAAPVTVDVRGMAIDLRLARAVPVALLTADAPIHVALIGPPPVTLDASASDGGHVRVASLPIAVQTTGAEMRAAHTFGHGAATVALRNRRADIVIDEMK